MKVLMTSGGTREPIDGVRFLSNFSSGTTGSQLAEYFRKCGHDVTFIHGKDSKIPSLKGENIEFVSFKDLESLLKIHLGSRRFDSVIHLAAISDYSIESIEADGKYFEPSLNGKLSSDSENVIIRLKKNAKLIQKLREVSEQKDFTLVGFKLTHTKDENERMAAIKKLAADYQIDYIVHNDLSEISKNEAHVTRIYKNSNGTPSLYKKLNTKQELATELEKIVKESV